MTKVPNPITMKKTPPPYAKTQITSSPMLLVNIQRPAPATTKLTSQPNQRDKRSIEPFDTLPFCPWREAASTYLCKPQKVGRDLKVSEKKSVLLPDDIYPPYFADIGTRSGAGLWGNDNERDFRLIKLHGSVNWHYSGRDDFHGETIFYSDVPGFGPADNVSFRNARTRKLLDMAADKETLIIPPVSEKTIFFNNETVKGIWKGAAAALRGAAALYIVGYSLPASDLGMRFFLSGNNPPVDTPVHVVNTDAEVLERYKQVLQRPEMSINYLGSDEPVIRMACDYLALATKST